MSPFARCFNLAWLKATSNLFHCPKSSATLGVNQTHPPTTHTHAPLLEISTLFTAFTATVNTKPRHSFPVSVWKRLNYAQKGASSVRECRERFQLNAACFASLRNIRRPVAALVVSECCWGWWDYMNKSVCFQTHSSRSTSHNHSHNKV